jgi:hypothetical protein
MAQNARGDIRVGKEGLASGRRCYPACVLRGLRTLGMALGLVLLGCDGETWLSWRGVPSFREVDAHEGHALAAHPGARLVQLGRGPGAWAPLPGAQLFEAEETWPRELEGQGPVVIVAADPQAGFRLAARLARAGEPDVAVVAGGLEAWAEDDAEVAAADRPPS